jgi:hypothetical protein
MKEENKCENRIDEALAEVQQGNRYSIFNYCDFIIFNYFAVMVLTLANGYVNIVI